MPVYVGLGFFPVTSQRINTFAGPGMSLSPDSHRRMVRPSETSNRRAHALVDRPSS